MSRGGVPRNLTDEALALFSGIRIINVDVPRTMQYKITEYNKNKRLVTSTEKLFSLQDYLTRGPAVLLDEFRAIQDENYRVNRNFYNVLKDAETVGMSERDLRKLLNQRGISRKNARSLLKGKNIPYAEANKEADKKKRESVDVRNQADTLIHSTEKNLKEHGSKISDAEKKAIEDASSAVKEAINQAFFLRLSKI